MSARLSNQDSRDRLRESRTAGKKPYHETDAERRGRRRESAKASRSTSSASRRSSRHHSQDSNQIESPERFQGAAASQPELRLRAPKRQQQQNVSPESNYEARSKTAERERAAGRPVRRIGSKLDTSTSRGVARRSISYKDTDPLAKVSSSGRSGRQKESTLDEKFEPNRKTKEQREVDRKQRARRGEHRLRVLKIAGMFTFAASVLGLLIWGGFVLADSSLFYPDDVQVQGARFLSIDDIESIAQVSPAHSTLTMDTSEIEDRLQANPWIARASVSTHFPSGVSIEISERTPAIKVEAGEVSWVASSDGRWLGMIEGDGTEIINPTGTVENVDVENFNIIPVSEVIEFTTEWGEPVADESLQNVLAHLRGLDSQIVSRVQRISASEIGRTSLFTTDGVELDVGRADNLADKSTIILGILEAHGENVVLINVRSIENPTWRGLNVR
ncbi:MAG: FtsQ-type POTRA domain-containing protein [Coriobacteriia bacterium]|nr:FtsQ-type POTRA domain-containing protein [Coriobacteriia bacterium]